MAFASRVLVDEFRKPPVCVFVSRAGRVLDRSDGVRIPRVFFTVLSPVVQALIREYGGLFFVAFRIADVRSGLFVDQSWMDFAPSFVEDVAIERDTRFNLAYWNLSQRRISKEDDELRVDGEPIGFVHLSGIDLGDPDSVSKHQNRLSLCDLPELRQLYAEYRRLVEGAGHDRFHSRPYGYQSFDGVDLPIPGPARRLLGRVDPFGRRWPNRAPAIVLC